MTILFDGGSVAADAFLSQTFHELELERIFGMSWAVVGLECELDHVGSFVTSPMAGDDVVVVRQADGEVRVFLNVCRHRGRRIASGKGQVDSFRCRHRGWTYSVAGSLVSVPGEDLSVPSFDPLQYGLVAATDVEVRAGWVFARWETGQQPTPSLAHGAAGRTRSTVDVASNWKCAMESLFVGGLRGGSQWMEPNTVLLADHDAVLVLSPVGVSTTTVVAYANRDGAAQEIAQHFEWTIRGAEQTPEGSVVEAVVCSNTGAVCKTATGPDGCPLARAGTSGVEAMPRRPVPAEAEAFYRYWADALGPDSGCTFAGSSNRRIGSDPERPNEPSSTSASHPSVD